MGVWFRIWLRVCATGMVAVGGFMVKSGFGGV